MPRNPRRCSHCRSENHVITHCVKWETELELNIIGRFHRQYHTHIPTRKYSLSKISLPRLSQMRLLMEGAIPYISRRNYIIRNEYNLCVVRYENNQFMVTFEEPTLLNESVSDAAIDAHPNTIKQYTNEYKERIAHYKNVLRGNRYNQYLTVQDLTSILIGDYMEASQRILLLYEQQQADYQRRQADYNRDYPLLYAQNLVREAANLQQQAENQQRHIEIQRQHGENQQWYEEYNNNRRITEVNLQNAIINREVLPILRNTAIESDDCPICLDAMGETGKVVLRCGHQLCVSCMVTQTLRSVATRNTNMCKCPVCRTVYM